MKYKTLEAIMSVDYKDVIIRSLWTFLQAFLAVFIVSGDAIIDLLFKADWSALFTLIIALSVSAIAAGLSAVKTIVINVLQEMKKNA